jgi:hypothetical protein
MLLRAHDAVLPPCCTTRAPPCTYPAATSCSMVPPWSWWILAPQARRSMPACTCALSRFLPIMSMHGSRDAARLPCAPYASVYSTTSALGGLRAASHASPWTPPPPLPALPLFLPLCVSHEPRHPQSSAPVPGQVRFLTSTAFSHASRPSPPCAPCVRSSPSLPSPLSPLPPQPSTGAAGAQLLTLVNHSVLLPGVAWANPQPRL